MSTAIVIGSGFGGLAAALRLRARGWDVRIVERLHAPGGRANSYSRAGFRFDAGPTIITAPFLLDELFRLFDRDIAEYVTLREVEPWYRIRFDDGEVFDYSGDLERTLSEIRRFEPSDEKRYLRFLDRTRDIFRTGFEELGDVPFLDWKSMARLAPKMIALQSYLSVYARTARYVKNPYLRKVFSFHPLLVGGNPFTTTSIYSLIHYLERRWGVHFVMGGTGALVDALVRLLREEGVSFSFGRTVEEILVEGGTARGVRLDSGEIERADIVVANADAPFVYREMIPERHRRKWTDRRVDRLRYSMGLFVLYFGADRTYPDLAHHEILLGPRYRELITDIFERKKLAEDFSLYLHAPTRTDASLAPEGGESMYALVPVPNLQSGTDWEEEGPRFRDRVLGRLESTVCPDLAKHLAVDFFVTPNHFRDSLLSLHGAGFSIEPLLSQSAYFRFHNRSEDIGNLYFVGAGTQPGAGLPGVLCSAKILDKLVPDAGSRSAPSGRRRAAGVPAG